MTRIEQTAQPTMFLWLPDTSQILTANDQYKFKIYNSEDLQCRKTVLGPTYGGPLNSLVQIPTTEKSENEKKKYFAYTTAEKVIGLVKFPLDGNPNNAMGLIAHPGVVRAQTQSGHLVFVLDSYLLSED